MYVFGGGNYVPKYHAMNEVWSSADGVHWEHVTEDAPWQPRRSRHSYSNAGSIMSSSSFFQTDNSF